MNPQDAASRSFTADRSPVTATVDSVLRRALKISNPQSADEVAKGLLARYTDEAAKIKREREGLPFSLMAPPAAVPTYQNGGQRPEIRTANDALELALKELTTDPDLADIGPELRGWATTIRRAAADGLASSRFSIDAGERDRSFGARRILGDYARLARYCGAVTQCATDTYCRVAQACDNVANLVLVMVGDALGDAAITRSGGILQVAATSLQTRRDGVLIALRNLLHPMPGDDQDTEPRASEALIQIYGKLETVGAADLRTMLDETYLARRLDDLIDLATGSTAEGLRALGSAAAVTVRSIERFLMVTENVPVPDAPPATQFFKHLELFVQGFEGGSAGYRMPYLSRSPLLITGYLASAGIDLPTEKLLRLALGRTALANKIDCLCCSCDEGDAVELILAGAVLGFLDRAIDHYALSGDRDGDGDGEQRAAAYGRLIFWAKEQGGSPSTFEALTDASLGQIIADLDIPIGVAIWAEIFDLAKEDEKRWGELVAALAPSCRRRLIPEPEDFPEPEETV